MRKRVSDKFRTALLYLRCSRAFPNRQISRGGAKNSSDSLSAPAPVRGAAAGRSGGNRLSDGQRRAPVGSGAESRPAQTQQMHRRAGGNARWRDSGHRKTSVLRMTSGSDVLRREGPPEAAAGKRRRTTPSAPGRMARGTNAGGGAEPHGGSRHRRRPARPHRAAHDDRRHYRPPRRHLTEAELPALCGDAGTMREKRGTRGRPPRTAEKRPDDRIRPLAMQF